MSKIKFEKKYDLIVIGCGHAGIEAALAAARLGCQTLLLTINMDTVGKMSCNPAIGGPAKSQLVFEIGALGGEMGKAADATFVQMKMLNLSKGAAVHALRAQIDRKEYKRYMKRVVENTPGLDLKQGVATDLIMTGKTFKGVRTKMGFDYYAKAVVVATGTFLNGEIFIGLEKMSAGRAGEFAAVELTASINKIGIKTGRLKTGTTPRIDGRSIDFSKMKKEPGMDPLRYFSGESERKADAKQLNCYLTHTNKKTHEIILNNLDRSPLYQKMIGGVGPRYCPSIEDKVVRFCDKDSHHAFIEPEGRDTQEFYVQGISTSLPYDVQLKMLQTMPGLENVRIMRPGYAIAYDFVYPEQITRLLGVKGYKGIFLAGQINGTSGYEEAAAQGLIAGINAAKLVQGEEALVLTRETSYIGTLIDDLVTKEIREPYRMMTSRSEYRLFLRQDNADQRLIEIGRKIGLVNSKKYKKFQEKMRKIKKEKENLKNLKIIPKTEVIKKIKRKGQGLKQALPFFEILKRPNLSYRELPDLGYKPDSELSDEEAVSLETEIKYAGYIKKVVEQIESYKKLEKKKIPGSIKYEKINGLRNEAKQKLAKIRPETIGLASRIAGVNPADISVLLIYLETLRRGNVSREKK